MRRDTESRVAITSFIVSSRPSTGVPSRIYSGVLLFVSQRIDVDPPAGQEKVENKIPRFFATLDAGIVFRVHRLVVAGSPIKQDLPRARGRK